jgi:hypothetical protein
MNSGEWADLELSGVHGLSVIFGIRVASASKEPVLVEKHPER